MPTKTDNDIATSQDELEDLYNSPSREDDERNTNPSQQEEEESSSEDQRMQRGTRDQRTSNNRSRPKQTNPQQKAGNQPVRRYGTPKGAAGNTVAKAGEKGVKSAGEAVAKKSLRTGSKRLLEAATSEFGGPVIIEAALKALSVLMAVAKSIFKANLEPLKKEAKKKSNLIFIIPFVVVFAIIIFMVMFLTMGSVEEADRKSRDQTPLLTFTKTGPTTAKNTDNLTYTLSMSYAGTAEDVVITDTIPPNATFVSATGKYTQQGNVITWSAKENGVATTAPGGGGAAACGQITNVAVGAEAVGDLCAAGNIAGASSKKIKPDGIYEATYFGCSAGRTDPGDNCQAAHQDTIPECNQPGQAKRGAACEEAVQFFAANSDQYGPNTKLKVTNPKTGQAVIVRVIDKGPNCSTQGKNAKFDISYAAYQAIGANGQVKVETVAGDPALGAVQACTDTQKAVADVSAQAASTFAPLTLTIVLKPTQPNSWVVNNANAQAVGEVAQNGGTTTGTADGFVAAAEANSCGGKYNNYITSKNKILSKNYGDPQCNFTKEKLKDLLIQKENNNMKFVDYWFVDIIPGESAFNPNAFAPPVGQQAQIDSGGAWGLYQMGSAAPAGAAPPAAGKNGPLDRGDVNWELQTSNAIDYNRTKLQCSFWYWSTYRRRHGKTNQC